MTTYYLHTVSGDIWTEDEILDYEASPAWKEECQAAKDAGNDLHSDCIWDYFEKGSEDVVSVDVNGDIIYIG